MRGERKTAGAGRCPPLSFMRYKHFMNYSLAGLILLLLWVQTLPCLFVRSGAAVLTVVPATAGMPVTIHFIHSVQKTPVWENLVVNKQKDGFVLQSTKYQSFGVGLPFLASEGTFHQEGDYFVMDGMERPYTMLSVRPGVGTELTLRLEDVEYRLYQMVPLGSRVDLYLAPYYQRFLEGVEANDGKT